MMCISIRQPWASLIVYGAKLRGETHHKNVENRTWPTQHRGDLLIHASKTIDKEAYDRLKAKGYRYDAMPTGAIMGHVIMIDCKKDITSSWHMKAHWGWYLCDPTPFKPVPYRGQLKLFDVDLETLVPGKKQWMWESQFVGRG